MKAVVILSGGMDSTTLLYDMVNQGQEVKALSFHYGQRHAQKELICAAKTCEKLKVDHKIVDLSKIKHLISNSALTGDIEVPEGHYEDESMMKTVVPNRNMIMLSIAIGYAENLDYKYVAIGNHSGDHAIYPDCRHEFIEALDKASKLGTYSEIRIFAPYTHLSKGDIATLGLKLGIDYDHDTWSCYKGGDEHCGKCGTCVERIEALAEAKANLTQGEANGEISSRGQQIQE
jgi:7-cyano-7-deazaguanine synthase